MYDLANVQAEKISFVMEICILISFHDLKLLVLEPFSSFYELSCHLTSDNRLEIFSVLKFLTLEDNTLYPQVSVTEGQVS